MGGAVMDWDPFVLETYWPAVEFAVFFVLVPFGLVALFAHFEAKRVRRNIEARMAAIEACRRKQEEWGRKWKERLETGRKETEHER
jgi:hypothetical protein